MKPKSSEITCHKLKYLSDALRKYKMLSLERILQAQIIKSFHKTLYSFKSPTKKAFYTGSKLYDSALNYSDDFNSLEKSKECVSFAKLLRNSSFINLGDPQGKIVIGKIFHVVGNDLYIDFGWKFHCVCQKPMKNANDYRRGSKVRLKIKDLELSTKFLGSTKDTTLLEADCILLGLVSKPSKPVETNNIEAE